MKKFFVLLTNLFLICPLYIFSQSSNWNSTINLNVTVSSSDRIDLFTNKNGHHVIVQKSNQLTYYLFSATGNQIRSSVIDNLTENPRLSGIAGFQDTVYICYKNGGNIKTKRTTNSGITWSSLSDINLPNSNSNGLALWVDANGLHIAYSAYDSQNSEYNTFYQRHPNRVGSWTDFKQVTDEAGDAGGFPSVTTSANRVHVAFTDGDYQDPVGNHDLAKTRDRYNGTWQNSQQIFNDAARGMVVATSSKLHGFYYDYVAGWGFFYYDLYYINRDLGSNTWSSPQLLQSYSVDPGVSPVDMAVTADDRLHIVSTDKEYRVWQNSWSSVFTFTSDLFADNQQIAANSNDVYVIWNTGSTIKLRQRDYAPLAPANLTVTTSANNHPLLSWDANNEADLNNYKIYKKKGNGGWNFLNTSDATTYEDDQETVVRIPEANAVNAYYKITATDLSANESAYSNTVSIVVTGPPGFKIGMNGEPTAGIPQSLQLLQNYPNPFNPSTNIAFYLPEAAQVEVSIYSLTGEKVITLLNGYNEAGTYQVSWDGKDAQGNPVGSGIYLYQLKTGEKRLMKKMILIK